MTVENTSGYHPLGRAVLVRPYELESKQGSIIIPESVQERQSMLEQRAVVIETGPLHVAGEETPRCVAGDKVMVSKMAGFHLSEKDTKDGVRYRVVNHQDIFLKVEG